jgi:GT2 family glycosyltransferase
MLWTPEREAPSAWVEHVPFAFWLVDVLRPQRIVELGTHTGVSYSAMCQAVKTLGLATSCFAIDTWKGDEHAGLYGEDAYGEFAAFHDRRYSAFSRMIRSTFDEALHHFEDGSIDLLHIDGLHTYEAVRHDYEAWLPKLAANAVVLLHDINVRERDFGVFRLWNEITAGRLHFDFLHGHGLGVLGHGQDYPDALRALFGAGDDKRLVSTIRETFATLGHSVRTLAERRSLDQSLSEHAKELDRLRKALAEREGEFNTLRTEFHEREGEFDKLRTALRDREHELGVVGQRLSDTDTEIATLRTKSAVRDGDVNSLNATICALRASTSWRITAPLRAAKRLSDGLAVAPVRSAWLQVVRMRRVARTALALSRRVGTAKIVRAGWHVLRYQGLSGVKSKLRRFEGEIISRQALLSPDYFEGIAQEIVAHQQSELSAGLAEKMQNAFSHQPLISVIMPVYKTPPRWLRRAVESLQEQYYGRWELCAVDDCSPTSDQRNLLQELAASDARVRFKVMERNGGISAASNAALEMARGEYVALLDHDDELTPDALFRVVEAINRQPDLDFVYSDECKVDDTPARRLFHFVFKPDWSPEIMFNGMLTGHLTVYRKALVDDLGGFRSPYDFSQDYDLALRMAEVAKRIVHIERVLYLWRSIPGSAASGGKDFARESNIAALKDALLRRGIPGAAFPLPHVNCVRIAVPAETTRVSIVIPSDSAKNLQTALHAIRQQTAYPNYEVVVVCNGPLAERLRDEFFEWEKLRFVKYNKKYNFSDKCNEGARAADGEIVVFYNDDVFPMHPDWIERLIEYLWVPGVGGVSPKLLHLDDTIQYAGMISGTPGLCGTAYNNVPNDAWDAFLTMHKWVRNVSILSGACCALWKDAFWKVGGFDAVHTSDGHSDMDLSYKLIESGYRCVYTPHALLRHIGNHSWGAKRHKYKADIYALKRWGANVSADPYFTDSMKRISYRDFRFAYRIYAEHLEPQASYSGPDVLFVSHELSLTGSPRMLFYAAKLVREKGGFPVVVAPADGPLREEMVRAGIVVIVDKSIGHNHFLFERFARNFDLAVVNTLDMTDVVRQLSAIPILRTVWWLHEAQSLSLHLRKVQDVQWTRVRAVCVSEYAKSFVPKGIDVEVLCNGIPDEPVDPAIEGVVKPLTFMLSGTIEPRKGQDILVEAISLLPQHVRQQCRFVLTGMLWDVHRNFWHAIGMQMTKLPEIEYLGVLDHKSQLRLMASADVLVCCSRDEPCSLVVMEAAMLSKPAIVSDRVGLRTVFDDESCFVFEPESPPSLAGQLLAAYEHWSALKRMGEAARRKFEQELTLEAFGARFLSLVSAQIAEDVASDSEHREGLLTSVEHHFVSAEG